VQVRTHFFQDTVSDVSYLDMLKNYVVPGLQMNCDNLNELYVQQDEHHTISFLQFVIK
jgi:hypothetical protein